MEANTLETELFTRGNQLRTPIRPQAQRRMTATYTALPIVRIMFTLQEKNEFHTSANKRNAEGADKRIGKNDWKATRTVGNTDT